MSNESSRRHLFISHFHKDDVEVSKLTNLLSSRGFDVRNSSIRVNQDNKERLEKNQVSKKVIERLLQIKISWASTVVVLIGKDTHTRPWVNWEIDKANEQGKRIVGVYVQGGSEADIPISFEKYGSALVKWNSESIMGAIDGENNFEKPDGGSRPPTNSSSSSNC